MNQLNYIKRPQIGIILLAAGASRRMGSPKQLLQIGQQTLIEKTIDIANMIEHSQTVVVLGANASKIVSHIKNNKAIEIIINKNWQKGMGTSLGAGIHFFLKKTFLPEVIIVLVCDQPYLTKKILEQLIDAYQQTQAGIVVAQYEGIKGVPALFSKELFPKLMELREDEGARKIIKKYIGKVISIDFPEGIIDLDTPEAYQKFLEKQGIKNTFQSP